MSMDNKDTRRSFLKASGALLGGAVWRPRLCFGAAKTATPSLSIPTPAQVTWQNCEIGLIYHFDMPTAAGTHIKNNTSRKIFDTQLYNPVKMDTDQWLEAAKAAYAKPVDEKLYSTTMRQLRSEVRMLGDVPEAKLDCLNFFPIGEWPARGLELRMALRRKRRE